MSFDESLLEEPARLEQRDVSRLLWSLATAGPQVRRGLDAAGELDLGALRDAAGPRALLVAVEAGASSPSSLLARLAEARAPALVWDAAALPRWAGPADALLVGSADGRDPRTAELVAQAGRRGLAVAVAAPAGSRVAAATGRGVLAELPGDLHPLAARWAVLTPLLQALDALALATVPPEVLVEVADALDAQAESCRVQGDAFTNPAKAMAVELAAADALVVGAGTLAGVAATTIAETLAQLAGRVAGAVTLPAGTARAAALLRGDGDGGDPDDLFRDRVDDIAPRVARLLVVGTDGADDDPLLGDPADVARRGEEAGARHAAAGLTALADALGRRWSTVESPGGDPLARYAAACALGDFTAAYLALGLGLDGTSVPVDGRER